MVSGERQVPTLASRTHGGEPLYFHMEGKGKRFVGDLSQNSKSDHTNQKPPREEMGEVLAEKETQPSP